MFFNSWSIWALVFLVAISQPSPASPRVLYGEDNRHDLHEVTRLDWLEKAHSTVALIKSKYIKRRKDDSFEIMTKVYGPSKKLCESEKFYEQEKAAFCSGVLIDEDLILTAGHCVHDPHSCGNTSFVFDFSYKTRKSHPSIRRRQDVYSCQKILATHYEKKGADFSIVKLDRKVTGRLPLSIREKGKISSEDETFTIGHPGGLPTKIADQGRIRSNHEKTFFTTELDTYHGSSGGPVFNTRTGLIEGILVRGSLDFIQKGRCKVSNICLHGLCDGEDVTRISEILPFLKE